MHYENLELENIDGEIWKDIPNYEGYYQASSMGRIKSMSRDIYLSGGRQKATLHEMILIQHIDKKGYAVVGIKGDNDKQRTMKVHQLVAKAFIPNPENKPTVDHLNGVKDDNRLDNLRWATMKEQGQTTKLLGLVTKKMGKDHHQSKDVYEYDLQGNLLNIWGSIGEAARNSPVSRAHIAKICNGVFDFSKNRVFSFEPKSQDYFNREFRYRTLKDKEVIKKNLIGDEICRYRSAKDAARENDIPYISIYYNLTKRSKSSYGYIWEYAV